MKIASLNDGSRDGKLAIVARDLATACDASTIAPNLQRAIDDWDRVAPVLRDLYTSLNRGAVRTAFAFDEAKAMAPLPRAFQWLDGSVYSSHGELMKRAFDTENKIEFPKGEPMMYQGGSDEMLGPREDIVTVDEAWGIDFEAEVAVVTGDVKMQSTPEEAAASIRLVMLANDVSLRNLIMHELGKGFGFYQSKPASAFSPVAVTPDELGEAWRDCMVNLPIRVTYNGAAFGKPSAGVGYVFNFAQIIAFAARTRNRFAERRLTALMQSGARLAGQNRRIASRQVPLANAI